MAPNWVCRGLQTKFHNLLGTILMISKLLHVYFLKHRVKAFVLVSFVVTVPWLTSIIRRDLMVYNLGDELVELKNVNIIELEMFQMFIHNMTNEGFLGLQDKGFVVNNDDKNEKLASCYYTHLLKTISLDLISYSDLERKQTSLDQNYDFAFTNEGIEELTDKVLKLHGIMIVQKKGIPKDLETFQKPLNYEFLYQTHYEPKLNTTIMAMKKTSMVSNGNPHRRLMFEQKKAEAIKKLENVLLEPPRAASGKSKTYSKKTRYLPDLMGDSLEDYPRLVFIDVNGDVGWFTKNYPTRNKDFEIFQIETTIIEVNGDDDEPKDVIMETEITDWLTENVKKGEYVVMKAEADIVEELVNKKAIELVDELFMECKYQGKKCEECKRPYWKCLALYGQLRDLGVAVHQWWG